MIRAYLDFEIDYSLSLKDNICSVHESWMRGKNVDYVISERHDIRNLLDTLALCEECNDNLILEKMVPVVLLENPRDVELVDFCDTLIEHWKTYIGNVISHNSAVSYNKKENHRDCPEMAIWKDEDNDNNKKGKSRIFTLTQ
ncbi:hypothetical protein Adt_11676 [Abeliophyllum distichum]|uniref:Uncharacterized protein n=1 Tax=Abeliophyllum distichum TaxID=126358 RepID=A0ABD1UNM7_9LAMI